MNLSRLIRRLAMAGAYASGIWTIALGWLDRPNRLPLAAFVALAALGLFWPGDDDDCPSEACP